MPRAVTDYADQIGADLVAAATRERGAVRRAALGSVADATVRPGGGAPILICHSRAVQRSPPAPAGAAGLGPRHALAEVSPIHEAGPDTGHDAGGETLAWAWRVERVLVVPHRAQRAKRDSGKHLRMLLPE